MRRTLAVVSLAAALAAPTAAQPVWDSPAFISPAAPSGVSVFLVDAAGADLGVLATFRHSAGPVGLGYRLMVVDEADPAGDVAIAGGVDVSGYLSRAVEGSEVDVIWWSGGGIGIGDETVVSVPLGIVLGWTGSGGDAVLSPYVGGHVSLDISSVDNNNLDLAGAVDLGIDVVLPSQWLIRFGASVADRETIAIGFKIPT